MFGNSEAVLSVAVRGNLIVSDSDHGLLYRWNATTGKSIGSALQGQGGTVGCVAVSADGQLILSGSRVGHKMMGCRYWRPSYFSFENKLRRSDNLSGKF